VRAFLLSYRERYGSTVLLTSHYMADVTALAPRVLIIQRGRVLYDGALRGLVEKLAPMKRLELVLADGVTRERLAAFGEVRSYAPPHASLEVPRDAVPRVSAQLLAAVPVADLSIQDPPVEEVIRRVFESNVD
jgi:ABC-2 type transport system ATP-binding protein